MLLLRLAGPAEFDAVSGAIAFQTGRAAGCRAIAAVANMPPIDSMTKEQLTRALGQAVIRIWSNLPQDVQDHLFKEAVAFKVSPLDLSLPFSCMTSIRARRTHWATLAK